MDYYSIIHALAYRQMGSLLRLGKRQLQQVQHQVNMCCCLTAKSSMNAFRKSQSNNEANYPVHPRSLRKGGNHEPQSAALCQGATSVVPKDGSKKIWASAPEGCFSRERLTILNP